MKLNRKWVLVIALLLSMTMATASTLAYLTDHDTDINTFTMGNVDIEVEEEFDPDSPLPPNVEVEKKAKITNTHNNSEAWVWMTVSVPEELDDYITLGWLDGYEGEELTEYTVHEGYVSYVVKWPEALEPGESTPEFLQSVTLTGNVDFQDGEYVVVEDGVIKAKLGDLSDVKVIVDGFAVQVPGFDSVDLAFEGYTDQWDGLQGGESGSDEEAVHACWDGTSDTSWFNDSDTEFVITTAEQLAGLRDLVDGGETFEGKTIKLANDLNLNCSDCHPDGLVFDPIGSYRKEKEFMGTFDGQSNTIKNLTQDTWSLDNGYSYSDLGLGLFGGVRDATIKDLTMDGASISGESAICGTVAATAYGNCTFENITVKNSEVADYQYYAGGVVGWASGDHKYVNCDVEASSTIAAQWGDFDNSVGGLIGGCGGSATILIEDCDVACRIDAYNDVTSSYQWYAYRRCGMLIGNTGKTTTVDGTTYAAAPQLTAKNCTVTYGDWANYTYCEFAGKSWPYVRVQAGVSNSAYSNPRYGHPTDANGNEVVDDSHVHNAGEDHFIACTFDQLYGGGQGVYGQAAHSGVKVVYNNK